MEVTQDDGLRSFIPRSPAPLPVCRFAVIGETTWPATCS